ncbi:DsbA family protein [Nodosilinea sp. PGN35]|uniref:DsbA family protein n=1 Tax=Nodosilinea sp. PGN35 TaxID=3020489 RepID=UPI0023B2195D|nr:DsbA family protein [Nodosilinea sp. TSF1-S3]MDF0364808.1 DsbA family protein [Nodosilinea sp. TSF1-S3]
MHPVSELTQPVSPQDHLWGPPTAQITLVQYGGYQCPNCGSAYPLLLNLLENLGDRLCFVFRHFPRSEVYPHAQHAAEAAEAAASQGKFWPMHDQLYTRQHALGNGYLVEYAANLGLDVRQFLREVTGDRFVSRIQADIASGRASGVIDTPTFFINGQRYHGAPTQSALLAALSITQIP